MPAPDTKVQQTDGWSCGYHVCHRIEEQYKEFRGEGQVHNHSNVEETRQELNKWIKALMDVKSKQREGESPGRPGKTSSSSSSALKLPPLPPPSQPPPANVGAAKATEAELP